MDHRLEVVVHPYIWLAITAAEHAVQVRRPVVLVAPVEVHDVVAEIGDLLRDRELRLAAAERFFGVAPDGDVADEADEARRIRALNPADGELCRKFAAVAPLREQLAADADDARLARLDVVAQVIFVLRTIRLGQQHIDL
jgi:hypothetical protein